MTRLPCKTEKAFNQKAATQVEEAVGAQNLENISPPASFDKSSPTDVVAETLEQFSLSSWLDSFQAGLSNMELMAFLVPALWVDSAPTVELPESNSAWCREFIESHEPERPFSSSLKVKFPFDIRAGLCKLLLKYAEPFCNQLDLLENSSYALGLDIPPPNPRLFDKTDSISFTGCCPNYPFIN